MVQNPVVGSIGQMLLSFNSASQTYVETFPELEGKSFGELYKWCGTIMPLRMPT